MNIADATERLAVCSWSLEPTGPQDLVAKLRETGIRRMQLALDPLRSTPSVWGNAGKLFEQEGVAVVSGMFGCLGEDYTTLDSIRRTGGILPDATWEQNRANFRATAMLARELGLQLVTFHAGFIPHDQLDPDFAKIRQRLDEVAVIFAEHDITVGLETGQETAPVLATLLETLDRPNLGVNFDPANMILYEKGDPIAAVRLLSRWIRQVHLKDAKRTQAPGTWGQEVPVGTGEVDWAEFFGALKGMNFSGDIVIEREAGAQRVADIRVAADVFRRLNG